jgi:hypothetical protein
MSTEEKKRTALQNRSLHSSLDAYAEQLNDSGYEYTDFIATAKLKGFQVSWTKENLKMIFNVVTNAMYGISSSNLTTKQLSECWKVFGQKMSENSGVPCEWRSRSE